MPAPTYTPRYNIHYGTTSGTFNAGEALHWSGAGGASTGTLVNDAIDDTTPSADLTFSHLTGPGPQIGDVIDGDVTHAQRTITSFNTTVANPGIVPVHLPAFGATDVTGIELDIDITETSPVSFRTVFAFFGSLIGGVSGWSIHTPNNYPAAMPNDFSGYWSGGTGTPIVAGLGIGFSAQFADTAQAGLDFHQPYTGFPRWNRYFANVDNLGVSWPTLIVRDNLATIGTIRTKGSMCQFVTDPIGNLSTEFPQNTFEALTGDFAVWRIDMALGTGSMKRMGVFFIQKNYQQALSPTGPIALVPEHFTNYPSYPTLADGPIDYRYSVRLYDKSTKLWHELPDWKISGQTLSPDPDYGWSPSRSIGKLSALTGTAAEQVNNRYLFACLTYHRGDTYADLPFDSVEDIVVGGATYNGSSWHDGTGFPSVSQEAGRGFLWMRPDTTVPAVLQYTAPLAATYQFTGDFARANDSVASGDGVAVSVVADGTTLHSDTIGSNHAVTTTSDTTIFAGTGKSSFDVSATLSAGDLTRFIVSSGGADRIFDATAFRTKISYLRSGRVRTPVAKGDSLYVRPGYLFQTTSFTNDIVRPLFAQVPVAAGGLRHQVFFFNDADDAEIWSSLPDGTVAVALAQSEADASADIRTFLNTSSQLEFDSTSGNRKVWVHTWSRSDRRASSSVSSIPPVTAGTTGYVPRGSGMYSHDPTLSGDNLANGRIINFHAHRHTVLGFRDIVDGDTFVARRGVVATAFQPAVGLSSFVSSRVAARDSRSTTIQLDCDGTDPDIEGWLHLWSR